MSSDRPLLRYVWIILLALGLGLTVFQLALTTREYLQYPTSSVVRRALGGRCNVTGSTVHFLQVQLEEAAQYEYDPMILCPDGWMDAEKALAAGLSLDGLQYSLAYHNSFDSLAIANVTQAKKAFLEFYTEQNFSSYLEFLKFITIDPQLTTWPSKHFVLDPTTPSYACDECQEPVALEKTFISDGSCYKVQLQPAKPRLGVSTAVASVMIALNIRNHGINAVSEHWRLNFCSSNYSRHTPACPGAIIKSARESKVKVSSEKFVNLPNGVKFCRDVDKSYSQAQCVASCQTELMKDVIGCQHFSFSPGHQTPDRLCNHLDGNLPLVHQSWGQLFSTIEGKEMLARLENECVKRCPRPCVKYVNALTLENEFDLREYGAMDSMYSASYPNRSLVVVHVTHSAALEGGIFTWTEVQSFTPTQLISNFGGALGLFVGGTIMTVAQLILFLVDYLTRERLVVRTAREVQQGT